MPRHRSARARTHVRRRSRRSSWLRMALPFALNHINLWLLRDSLPAEPATPAREGWSDRRLRHRQRGDARRLGAGLRQRARRPAGAARHRHPHAPRPHRRGPLAVRALERAPVDQRHRLRHRPDGELARAPASAAPLSAAFMAVHGLAADPAAVDGVASRTNYYRNLVPAVPNAYRRLLDGERARDRADGAEAQLDLPRRLRPRARAHRARLRRRSASLISGDMVLPRISTNVSVIDVEPEADPLTLYLDSIERMRAIDAEDPRPAVARAAVQGPAHAHRPAAGAPRRALRRDARGLRRARRRARSSSCRCCSSGQLDLHQMTFAMGESIAHLHALWFRGRLERHVGADGVIRFSTRSEALSGSGAAPRRCSPRRSCRRAAS